MTVKFMTVKGPDRLARSPFYLGIPQHERTIPRREAYELIAAATGKAEGEGKAEDGVVQGMSGEAAR